MTTSVEDIRQRYPHPKPADKGSFFEDYCVGGAVVMAYEGSNDNWPTTSVLANTLARMNGKLHNYINGNPYARLFAARILIVNDIRERTDLAWRIVEMALNFDPKRQHLVGSKPWNVGLPIIHGGQYFTIHGEHAMVEDIIPPHKPSSTGRVILEINGGIGEYFPSVIGAEWINREDQ